MRRVSDVCEKRENVLLITSCVLVFGNVTSDKQFTSERQQRMSHSFPSTIYLNNYSDYIIQWSVICQFLLSVLITHNRTEKKTCQFVSHRGLTGSLRSPIQLTHETKTSCPRLIRARIEAFTRLICIRNSKEPRRTIKSFAYLHGIFRWRNYMVARNAYGPTNYRVPFTHILSVCPTVFYFFVRAPSRFTLVHVELFW